MCAKTTPSNTKPLLVKKFRLHGIRKLNWVMLPKKGNYDEHLGKTGFDRWIEPGKLTIIIGPNAGGKSTVIDLFRAIADASLWPSLARENYPGRDFSGFEIESLRCTLSGKFSRSISKGDELHNKIAIFAKFKIFAFPPILCKCEAPKFPSTESWDTQLQTHLDQHVGIKVHYYPATGEYPASEIDDATLVDLLNELSEHLPSVFANPQFKPFSLFNNGREGEGRIGIFFKDDLGQRSYVHRSRLPLGWMQFASILHFLQNCEPSSLILLDEPDRHMHPSMQRILLEFISRERARLGAQIFLATHSSVLINPELCQKVGASVIVAAQGRCERLTDNRRILDDLGVTSGDLAQANGVIWVEGPSDRVYIKRWLELYAAHIGQAPPIERIHYAFASYGGSLIKHIALSDASHAGTNLLSINRNFAIVIDRDNDSPNEEDLGKEKKRLLFEAESLNAKHAVWITDPYTIEVYLPMDWEHYRYIVKDSEGRVRVNGISKVALAERFAKADMTWETSYHNGKDLSQQIETLFKRITAWQSPQEVITPTDIPPFFMGIQN